MTPASVCAVLRDLFSPFRPVSVDPAWLRHGDGAVGKTALAIYEEREFGQLPVLADALEDAGCQSEYLLAHLRSKARSRNGLARHIS